jgi:NAD(P)-dependent dehydrogenase (short-subunit alcohol dehydrogenase family)
MTSLPDLSGRVALVTGASRGIGRAAALGLAKAGAQVLALARTVGGLEELDDEIRAVGTKAALIPLDLADAAAVDELGRALASRYPRLDILLANAGTLGELAPLADTAEKVWLRTIEVNLTANFRLIRALDPLLRASGRARVAFMTSSVGGLAARAYWGAYGVSKAGLEMLAKTYALETRTAGVRVSILDPGPMRTKMRAEAMPGEDPKTLPEPAAILPLLYHVVSEAYDGMAERFSARDFGGRASAPAPR